MKSTELRIWNRVQYTTGEQGEVVALTETEIAITLDRELIPESEYIGIPLFHDVLKDCGFTIEPQSPYKDKTAHVIGKDADRLIWCYGKLFKPLPDGFIGISQTPIEYLHQLQNLFYALTGTELNYSK